MNLTALSLLLKSILFVSFFISTAVCHAATEETRGEVKGVIKDTLNNRQGLEYATVALYNQNDSVLVTGTITDKEGYFIIRNIPRGIYFLKITCLGYSEKTIPDIKTNDNEQRLDLGEIKLHTVAEEIGEVVVSAERRPFEYHMDKDVINVAQSHNRAGSMTADILEDHPAVEKGLDGAIKLRGSTDFIVLINGKPTVDESTDILNQIPAASLSRIEIITNPSAKYGANHAAGIINLITKSNELNGFSGSVDGSQSTADNHNVSLSLSYRNKKMNISTAANVYRNPIFQDRTSVEERMIDGENGFQNFHSNNVLLWTGKSLNAGIDYFVSDRNTASVYVSRSLSVFGWSPQKTITEGIVPDTSFYILDDFMRNNRYGWHFNVGDVHRFNEDGHQLRFDAHLIVVNMARMNNQYLYNSNQVWENDGLAESYDLKRHQDITRQQYQMDYSLPLRNSGKLESGVLMTLDKRQIKNNIVTHTFSGNQVSRNNDEYRSFNNLWAAYATVTRDILGNQIQAGLRAEYESRNTTLLNGDFDNRYRQLSLFPNLNISRSFADHQRIGVGYSRSIWRPTDLQLNPTVYFRDISGEFAGNANVKPSYTNSLEFKYNRSFGESSVSVTGFYNRMKDKIMTIRSLTEDSVYRNSPENLRGKQRDIGVELAGSFSLLKWLSVNANGKVYNGYIKGEVTNQQIERHKNVWSARVITNIKPFDNMRIQANAYYNGPSLGDQVLMKEIYGLSISVSQQLFQKRLSVNISGNDVLHTEKRKFILSGSSFNQRITDRFPKHPVYTLSVAYKFNNYNKKQRDNVEQGIGFF
ncbi:TonB-dependent receptor [Prolixibacter bellariivorans]|uniref:TonB-dependent receptor n=1 Tax=Prolixibacter bellariivorans TaxID=314319 RepID=A0A5M4B482_9BACT|nr:outer membrane beta-barrel family protein [Prolixibacter bellariivorans]GET34965.1 TonB-dependent receptor [Prolixibacter bellariivorans]